MSRQQISDRIFQETTKLTFSDPPVVGKNSCYLGISAATGFFTNQHWIHDFKFTNTLESLDFQTIKENSNFRGDASVQGDSIRLTEDLQSQSGNVNVTLPVSFRQFNKNLPWEAYFEYSMGGGSRADGIAFYLQSNDTNVGGLGGGMGYQDIPNSIAVCFDTYNNSPAVPSDVSNNHIELNVNGSINSLAVVTNPSCYGNQGGQLGLGNLDLCGSTETYGFSFDGQLFSTRTRSIGSLPVNTPNLNGNCGWDMVESYDPLSGWVCPAVHSGSAYRYFRYGGPPYEWYIREDTGVVQPNGTWIITSVIRREAGPGGPGTGTFTFESSWPPWPPLPINFVFSYGGIGGTPRIGGTVPFPAPRRYVWIKYTGFISDTSEENNVLKVYISDTSTKPKDPVLAAGIDISNYLQIL